MEPRFQARTDATRVLTSVVSALQLRNATTAAASALAWCQISNDGLTLTVNEAKSLQAAAYLKRGLFHEFKFTDGPDLAFGLNLASLVECLRILSTGGSALDKPATLELSYADETSCLMLTLVDGGAVTQCKLHTMDIEPIVPVALAVEPPPPVRIVFRSDVLRDGLQELDWGGDGSAQREKRVTLRVLTSPPQLSFTVSSVDLGCEMEYPAESLIFFEAAHAVAQDYRFSLLHLMLKCIKESEEACLRLDYQGLLHLMCKFPSDLNSCDNVYVEFYLLPLYDDEDESSEPFGA